MKFIRISKLDLDCFPEMIDYELIFVYGTLMSSFDNEFARLLRFKSERIGKGCIPGKLYKISWYPGVVLDAEPNHLKVYGEVYSFSKGSGFLTDLDEYEGIEPQNNSGEYVRSMVEVTLDTNEKVNCWTYLYNWPIEKAEWIPSGCFSNELN